MRRIWLYGAGLALLVVLGACQTPPIPSDTQWQASDGLAHAPGRTGELHTITVDGQEFTYEVIDGLAVYQSDMILGDAASVAALADDRLGTSGVVCDSAHIATFFGWNCGRWADGNVPYSITSDWGSDTVTAAMHARINAAIDHWEENTNIRFQRSDSGVRVIFRPGDGCSSSIGRQENWLGDAQFINLAPDCGLSAVIHEIGHAVGLFHEQSRSDRDDHVQIHQDAVASGMGHNFNKAGDRGNDTGPYNFGSIMHYGCTAFSRDGSPTISLVDTSRSCADLGNLWLSDGDILATYLMYPLQFEISNVAAAADPYPRSARLEPRVTTERAIRSDFLHWYIDGTPVRDGDNLPSLSLADLTPGDHTLMLRIEISGVVAGARSTTFSVSNVAPEVTVVEPSTTRNFCINQNFNLMASVFDADSPPDYTVPNSGVSWTIAVSEENPAETGTLLGTGKSVTASFASVGIRSIIVRATDGLAIDEELVVITIQNCAGSAPVVQITSPASDISPTFEGTDEHGPYIDLLLAGSASDTEDGVLSGNSLQWFTNRADLQPDAPDFGDQLLFTGGSSTVRLYTECFAAPHVITLRATDSDGLTSSITRRISIQLLC